MNLRTINAQELANGYVWSQGIFQVYKSGNIYIVEDIDESKGFETLKEVKEHIKNLSK